MKILLSLMLPLFCIQAKAQTIYPSGVPNCIARYDFSTTQPAVTNLPDVSGNANNSSVVQNLTATNSWRNLSNKAMLFNGSSSFAEIPNSSNLTPQAITMVALVKLNGFYSGSCQFSQIMIKGYPAYIPGQYAMAVSDNFYDNDCGSFDPNHQQLVCYFDNSLFTPGMTPGSGNYINKEKWYFVAVSYDGNNLKFYQVPMEVNAHNNNVNAILSSTNLGNQIGTNTENITIGRTYNPPFPYWFNGVMDELVLFNTFLTTPEIQSVYDFLWVVLEVDPSFTKTDLCQGGNFLLPFKINAANAFQAGNIITAQLSDINGSFASPIDIGSATSVASGNISCNIPASTPLGSGYKIRLKASAPFEYSDVFESTFAITTSTTPPTVTLSVSPGTNVAPGQSVTFTANAGNAGISPSFNWKKNGAVIPGETANTYTTTSILNNDVVSVVVTSSDPCATPKSAESSSVNMTVTPNAISDVKNYISDFLLYPNPNNGSFTVTGNTEKGEPISLEVRNILGQKVYADMIIPKKGVIKYTINIANPMKSGIYLLVLSQSSGKMVKTFNVIMK